MKQHLQFFFSLLVFVFSYGCSSAQRHVDGGPCSYETVNYPAVILIMYPVVDSTESDMILAAITAWGTDTITFSDAAHGFISNEELKELNIKVGDTLNYQHKLIIEGSCNPDIWFLTREKYKHH